jgi:uncharacterized protein with HEPN domain
MKEKDNKILQKIIGYIDEIIQYATGLNFNSFFKDRKTTSACAFGILQIGELAKELSDDVQVKDPNIPWKGIRGMRNRIVHDYENVDFVVLWDTVSTSLPELKEQLTKLLENQ